MRIEPRAAILAVPDVIYHFGVISAVSGIEFGNYIPELGMTGSPGIYTTSYQFYTLLVFSVYVLVFRLISGKPGTNRISPLTPLYDHYANLIGLALVVILGLVTAWVFIRGLATGFPLLLGMDRFLYRRVFMDKLSLYALNDKLVIELTLGMVAFCIPAMRPIRRAALALALIFLMVGFLFGDKMTTQLIGLSGLFAPYLCLHYRRLIGRNLLPFVLAGTLAIVAVSSATWFIYSNSGRSTAAATLERLSGRLVGTGELWFLQARIGAPLITWESDFIERNVAALKVKDMQIFAVQSSLGPNFYSNRYAPDAIRNSIARNAGSSTFTAAYEPLLLYTFGWVGLGLALVVTGIIWAAAASYIMLALSSRSVPSLIFASFISLSWRTTTAQGSPWVTFGVSGLKILAMIALAEAILYFVGSTQAIAGRVYRREDRPNIGRLRARSPKS